MATEFGNIDDMLAGGKTSQHPETPEHQPDIVEDSPDVSYDEPESSGETPFEPQDYEEGEPEEPEEPEVKEPEQEYDEYGNAKAKPRTYTEDEVNERINKAVRERLARGNNNNNPAQQQQVQQQAKDFEYNPDAEGNWQQQLESFVEQTVSRMSQKEATRQQQYREEQAQAEFQDKFTQGMGKFSDFREVVGSQPVTDPMTIALRGMKDPASFIYAASKRNPQELQRISQLPDPVMQMVEMGKLEERMRKNAAGTKAPKPISRTREDAGLPVKDKKSSEPSIEDMIANADKKRMAQLKQRRAR